MTNPLYPVTRELQVRTNPLYQGTRELQGRTNPLYPVTRELQVRTNPLYQSTRELQGRTNPLYPVTRELKVGLILYIRVLENYRVGRIQKFPDLYCVTIKDHCRLKTKIRSLS